MPFQKGHVANPYGRPKVANAIAPLASKQARAALARLVRIAKHGADPVAVTAANSILDRAYGKAPQAITGEGGGPVLLSWESNTPAPVPPVKSVETS